MNTYNKQPKRIEKYARWALRDNGPGIWEIPTPVDCVVDKKDPGYIVSLLCIFSADHMTHFTQPPINVFGSKFIITLFGSYVKWCKGSCHDYGPLKGALGMSAAGVSHFLSAAR
jgi:hypothetical protein